MPPGSSRPVFTRSLITLSAKSTVDGLRLPTKSTYRAPRADRSSGVGSSRSCSATNHRARISCMSRESPSSVASRTPIARRSCPRGQACGKSAFPGELDRKALRPRRAESEAVRGPGSVSKIHQISCSSRPGSSSRSFAKRHPPARSYRSAAPAVIRSMYRGLCGGRQYPSRTKLADQRAIVRSNGLPRRRSARPAREATRADDRSGFE